jgi:4'-phosphopantetheinyl transferase
VLKLYFVEIENAKAHSEKFARNFLGEYLNTDGDNLVIRRTEYGKPYLRDYPDTHYNISHTRGVIVCAVSDQSVGVDIESVKPFNKRIVECFFTQNEQDYILTSKEDQDKRFAEIWTKKEAYVKWLGKGIAIPFESFDVLSDRKFPYIYSFFYNSYCIAVCVDGLYSKHGVGSPAKPIK